MTGGLYGWAGGGVSEVMVHDTYKDDFGYDALSIIFFLEKSKILSQNAQKQIKLVHI